MLYSIANTKLSFRVIAKQSLTVSDYLQQHIKNKTRSENLIPGLFIKYNSIIYLQLRQS